jgi:hypothetical protein
MSDADTIDSSYENHLVKLASGWNDKKLYNNIELSSLNTFVRLYLIVNDEEQNLLNNLSNNNIDVLTLISDDDGLNNKKIVEISSYLPQINSDMGNANLRNAGGIGINNLKVERSNREAFTIRYRLSLTITDPKLIDQRTDLSKLIQLSSDWIIAYGWDGFRASNIAPAVPNVVNNQNQKTITYNLSDKNNGYWDWNYAKLYKFNFNITNEGHLQGSLEFSNADSINISSMKINEISTAVLNDLKKPDSSIDLITDISTIGHIPGYEELLLTYPQENVNWAFTPDGVKPEDYYGIYNGDASYNFVWEKDSKAFDQWYNDYTADIRESVPDTSQNRKSKKYIFGSEIKYLLNEEGVIVEDTQSSPNPLIKNVYDFRETGDLYLLQYRDRTDKVSSTQALNEWINTLYDTWNSLPAFDKNRAIYSFMNLRIQIPTQAEINGIQADYISGWTELFQRTGETSLRRENANEYLRYSQQYLERLLNDANGSNGISFSVLRSLFTSFSNQVLRSVETSQTKWNGVNIKNSGVVLRPPPPFVCNQQGLPIIYRAGQIDGCFLYNLKVDLSNTRLVSNDDLSYFYNKKIREEGTFFFLGDEIEGDFGRVIGDSGKYNYSDKTKPFNYGNKAYKPFYNEKDVTVFNQTTGENVNVQDDFINFKPSFISMRQYNLFLKEFKQKINYGKEFLSQICVADSDFVKNNSKTIFDNNSDNDQLLQETLDIIKERGVVAYLSSPEEYFTVVSQEDLDKISNISYTLPPFNLLKKYARKNKNYIRDLHSLQLDGVAPYGDIVENNGFRVPLAWVLDNINLFKESFEESVKDKFLFKKRMNELIEYGNRFYKIQLPLSSTHTTKWFENDESGSGGYAPSYEEKEEKSFTYYYSNIDNTPANEIHFESPEDLYGELFGVLGTIIRDLVDVFIAEKGLYYKNLSGINTDINFIVKNFDGDIYDSLTNNRYKESYAFSIEQQDSFLARNFFNTTPVLLIEKDENEQNTSVYKIREFEILYDSIIEAIENCPFNINKDGGYKNTSGDIINRNILKNYIEYITKQKEETDGVEVENINYSLQHPLYPSFYEPSILIRKTDMTDEALLGFYNNATAGRGSKLLYGEVDNTSEANLSGHQVLCNLSTRAFMNFWKYEDEDIYKWYKELLEKRGIQEEKITDPNYRSSTTVEYDNESYSQNDIKIAMAGFDNTVEEDKEEGGTNDDPPDNTNQSDQGVINDVDIQFGYVNDNNSDSNYPIAYFLGPVLESIAKNVNERNAKLQDDGEFTADEFAKKRNIKFKYNKIPLSVRNDITKAFSANALYISSAEGQAKNYATLVKTTFDLLVDYQSVDTILNNHNVSNKSVIYLLKNILNYINAGVLSNMKNPIQLAFRKTQNNDEDVVEIYVESQNRGGINKQLKETYEFEKYIESENKNQKVITLNHGDSQSLVESFNISSKIDPLAYATFQLPFKSGITSLDISQVIMESFTDEETGAQQGQLKQHLRQQINNALAGRGFLFQSLISSTGNITKRLEDLTNLLNNNNPDRITQTTFDDLNRLIFSDPTGKTMDLLLQDFKTIDSNVVSDLLLNFLFNVDATIHGTTGIYLLDPIIVNDFVNAAEGIYIVNSVVETLTPNSFNTVLNLKLYSPIQNLNTIESLGDMRPAIGTLNGRRIDGFLPASTSPERLRTLGYIYQRTDKGYNKVKGVINISFFENPLERMSPILADRWLGEISFFQGESDGGENDEPITSEDQFDTPPPVIDSSNPKNDGLELDGEFVAVTESGKTVVVNRTPTAATSNTDTARRRRTSGGNTDNDTGTSTRAGGTGAVQ